MLKDDFLVKLKDSFPNYEEFYEVIEYISSREVIVENKYGTFKQTAYHLIEGKKPSIRTAIDKVKYVKNVLHENFPNYLDFYEVVDYVYVNGKRGEIGRVVTKDEFGLCSNFLGHLKMGKIPKITTALDTQDYFEKKLLKYNKHYREGLFQLIDNYSSSEEHIIVRTEFGDCLIKPSNLMQGDLPTIESAVCKTTYFLNKLKKFQIEIYNNYDFKKFIYKNNTAKSIIICGKHKEVMISPAVLLRGSGCEQCGYDKLKDFKRNKQDLNFSHTSWVEQANKSKNFDTFKVYIIRCWNDEEEFYKIGKTFLKFRNRFYDCNIPYNYEVVKIIESKTDGLYISKLEKKLQKLNKDNKYIPKAEFGGMYECFKIVDYEL